MGGSLEEEARGEWRGEGEAGVKRRGGEACLKKHPFIRLANMGPSVFSLG